MCLSQNSTAPDKNYSEICPNSFIAETQLHLIDYILKHFRLVSQPEFNCTLSKKFKHNSQLCLSRKSIASYWHFSKTLLNCVSAKFQLHPIQTTPDVSKLLYRRNSIAFSRWNFEIFSKLVRDKTHLHLLQKVLRQFQNVLQLKINCIWLKLFQNLSKLCLSWNSTASCRKYPNTVWNCVWAEVQLHRVEYVLRIYHIAS